MELDCPQLRPDLELIEEPDGVLVYDPARRGFYELAAEDLAVLRLLDGQHTVREIARSTRRQQDEVWDLVDDLSDLVLLADPEDEEQLAAWRAEQEEQDRRLQPILDSRPGAGAAARPICIVDDARFFCLCCGECCHYAVPVSEEERCRLEEIHWPPEIVPAEAGRLFQLHPGSQWGRLEWTIATQSQPTRCAFLDADNRCRVQGELGPLAKPFPCRLFPLAYPVLVGNEIVVSLSFECPTVYRTYDEGTRLAGQIEELSGLVQQMDELYALPDQIPVDGERVLNQAEYLAWEKGLLEAPAAPATGLGGWLEEVQRRWAELSPLAAVPDPPELAALARGLDAALAQNKATVAGCPEGEEGGAWASHVLEALAEHPEEAWTDLTWEDPAAADLFLRRFIRHFVEGKQYLLYQPLRVGVRAMATLLLLSHADAAMLAGGAPASITMLNRALSRWGRLFDLRAVRLAFLQEG